MTDIPTSSQNIQGKINDAIPLQILQGPFPDSDLQRTPEPRRRQMVGHPIYL